MSALLGFASGAAFTAFILAPPLPEGSRPALFLFAAASMVANVAIFIATAGTP